MSTLVQIASAPHASLSGALAVPAGPNEVGGVVVVHEFWGLSDFIRSVCDRLAESGLVGLAPDLFHGKRPATKPEAADLMRRLDTTTAIAEIGTSVAWLGRHPRSNGRVALLGFCMGGGLTFGATRSLSGLACAVPFYGVPALPAEAFTGVTVPIQAHFSKTDEWAKPAIAEQIRAQIVAGGGVMDLEVYDAGHAFMRHTDPTTYDEQASRAAWQRTLGFLKTALAQLP